MEKEALGLIVDIEARTAKLEQGLRKANAAQRKAAGEMEARARQSAKAIEDTYDKATGGIAGAFNRLGGVMKGRVGWQVQQTALQFGDLAVQIGSGTSAARALSQQLPQMLGAFGAFGALAGTAAAVLLPLASAMLENSEEAATLDDAMQRVKNSTDVYMKAIAAASRPMSDLRLEFRDMADEMQRINDLGLELASVSAAAATQGLGKKLAEEAGGLSRTRTVLPDDGFFGKLGQTASPGMYASSQITEFERGVARLERKYQLTGDAAERLAAAIEKLGNTKAADEQAAAIKEMMDALNEGAAADYWQKFDEFWTEIERGPSVVLGDLDEIRKRLGAFREGALGGLENLSEEARTLFQDLIEQHSQVMQRVVTQEQRTAEELIRAYDADTLRLKALNEQRAQAEDLLGQARRDGNAEQIAQFERIVAGIDRQIEKVKELARETDAAFQQMSKSIKQTAGDLLSSGFNAVFGVTPEQFGRDATAANGGLLELIASKESGGDYNATLDHGRWTGGPRDLVNMSLNEILALGDSMRTPENRALYGDGKGSSALGKYQITGQTLRGLIETLGLTGNELYDPAMQDRLATELIRQRRPQGVEGLRQEWAGLQNVPAAVIQAALGNTAVPTVDPEVSARATQASSERQRQLERENDLRQQASDTAKAFSASLDETLSSYAMEADMAGKTASQIAKARIEHQLYAQAARQGITVTAEMQAKISQVGDAAAAAAVEAPEFVNFLRDGLKDALLNAGSLEEGLAGVADAIRKAALEAALFGEGPMAALFGTAGGGGLFGFLGGGLASRFGGRGMVAGNDVLSSALRGAIGYSEGGYTGDGSKNQVAGLVHSGEYVLSKAAVDRIGVRNLEALHQGALKGYFRGGLVGDTGKVSQALSGRRGVSAGRQAITINSAPNITVNGSAGTPEQNADLANQIAIAQERALRGLVQHELGRQMRPGGMLR